MTSPTNDDFQTQLDNINDQVDAITPPSTKIRRSSTEVPTSNAVKPVSSKGLRAKSSGSKLQSTVFPKEPQLPAAATRKSAQQLYFFKKPKGNISHPSSKRNQALAGDVGKKPEESQPSKASTSRLTNTLKPISIPSNIPKSSIETEVQKVDDDKRLPKALKHIASPTKKLKAISETSFKTPHRNRSGQIASIRDKLRALAETNEVHDTSDSAAAASDVGGKDYVPIAVSTMNSPQETLMVSFESGSD